MPFLCHNNQTDPIITSQQLMAASTAISSESNLSAAPEENDEHEHGSATTFSAIPIDVLVSHILTRLDGRTLASASLASRHLRHLSSHLWSHICLSATWPSTSTSPSLRRLILSAYPGGPRSFFSDCTSPLLPLSSSSSSFPPSERLISAVDIRHADTLLFSRSQETDTSTGWFRCSPFRVDMLDPKESVPTRVPHPEDDAACRALAEEMSLSWIVADPAARIRAADLSSGRPVSVRRHWLSGEVELKFAAVLAGIKKKGPAEYVEFAMAVTCAMAEEEGGGMQVREVSLRAEDMEGKQTTGKDGMAILQRALEGKRGKTSREEEGKRRYEEYLERKRERKDRKVRAEKRMDRLCFCVGASIFALLCLLFICH